MGSLSKVPLFVFFLAVGDIILKMPSLIEFIICEKRVITLLVYFSL